MKQALEHRFEFLLQDWVEHNTFTPNHEKVKSFLLKVEEEVEGLGLQTEWQLSQAGTNTLTIPSALLGVLPSTNARATGPVITLVCHADTAHSPQSEFQGLTWSPDRKRAIGPGVLQNKGGILIGLFVLEQLVLLETRDFTVQFLCLPNAEEGAPGFQKFIEKISYRSQYVIGLDPSPAPGVLVNARRGARWYDVIWTGPGGLAGDDQGKIFNPLESLVRGYSDLLDKARSIKGLTLNIGAFTTDTQSHQKIPASATAHIDVRFETTAQRDQFHELIQEQFKDAEVKVVNDCPAFALEPKAAEFHKVAVKEITQNERTAGSLALGLSASGCNYLYRPGILMIDGLGPNGTGVHTNTETLEANSLFTRSKVILDLIDWAAHQK